jgi:hypothetical protein
MADSDPSQLKSDNGSPNTIPNYISYFPGNNGSNFKPITDLWTSKEPFTASTVAKECLSCDRWAGTMVMGGGVYLLWNARHAPSTASKIIMAAAGGAMVVGGSYQGWVKNVFYVRHRFYLLGTNSPFFGFFLVSLVDD